MHWQFCRSKWWTRWWGCSVPALEMKSMVLLWESRASTASNFQTVMWYFIVWLPTTLLNYLIHLCICWASFFTDGAICWCDTCLRHVLHIYHSNPTGYLFWFVPQMCWCCENVSAANPPCPHKMDMVKEQLQHGQLPKLLRSAINRRDIRQRQASMSEWPPSQLPDQPKLHFKCQDWWKWPQWCKAKSN